MTMRLSLYLLNKSICGNCWSGLINSSLKLNGYVGINRRRGISSSVSHLLNCDINILNKTGQLEVYSGPFDRGEICKEYQVEPRDLPKIDPEILINVPLIDVRKHFICFSFRRLRCIIQSDRSIFFIPSAEKVLREPFGIKSSIHWERIAQDYHRVVHLIHQTYSERLQPNELLKDVPMNSFEFRMTEINLEIIANGLKNKTNELVNEFRNVRESAYQRITIASLRELALLKEKIDKYKRNAELAHQAIIDVLAHDEDLIEMYLSDPRQRDLSDHIEAELLLEACAKQMAEIKRSISDLSDSVHTLESATGFMLDAMRNELIAFEIKINIITMGLGIGALIAGICGMNMASGLEQHPYAFYAVAGSTTCLMGGVVIFAFLRLLRYGKIRLTRSQRQIRL